MKILVTGKNGQVGWELQRTLAPLGEAVAVDRATLDLRNPDSIRAVIREVKPHLIVNPAAYTAVDKAESEPDVAQAVNGVAPGIMAEEAKRLGAVLVHYSTDYVFDGSKPVAYVEDDPTCPLNVYGRTKLAGEDAVRAVGVPHLILRTSWVYGVRGKNFLLTILRLAKDRDELKIVADQIGAPTWSRLIAETTAQIVAQRVKGLQELSGIYNFTAAGNTSWHGFASAIIESAGLDKQPRLLPIPTSEYPLPAARPKNSVLSNDKLRREFGVSMPDWRTGLELAMAELRANA
ncbi:MAG: dTDP-4-dehydrorhamnose reductase [Sulfuricella sp.]|nr:dTDP-4-dehydrorhamnose reductase [Sulfuricella sp.]